MIPPAQAVLLPLTPAGWVLLLLAFTWAVLVTRNETPSPSIGWKWWLFTGGALLCLRWPMLWVEHQLNPDESQLIAGAITLRFDPLFWRSVDGGTAGPVDFYPLLPAAWAHGAASYALARGIALAVVFAAVVFAGETLALLSNAALARIAVLPALAAIAFTTSPDFAHYSTELMPALLLAAAGYAAVRHAEASSSRDSGESRSRAVEGSSSSPVVATEGGNFERPKWAGLKSTSAPLDSSTRQLWLIALLLGSVPWAKLQATPLAAALWLLVVWHERRAHRGRFFFPLLAGALVPALICVGVTLVTGQLEHLIVPYVLNNFSYVGAPQFSWAGVAVGQWKNALSDGYLGFWIAGTALCLLPLAIWRARVAPAINRRIALAALLLLAVAIYSALAPRRPSAHHLQLLPVPLLWLTGAVLALAWPAAAAPGAARSRAWLAVVFLGCSLGPQIAWRIGGVDSYAAINASGLSPARRELSAPRAPVFRARRATRGVGLAVFALRRGGTPPSDAPGADRGANLHQSAPVVFPAAVPRGFSREQSAGIRRRRRAGEFRLRRSRAGARVLSAPAHLGSRALHAGGRTRRHPALRAQRSTRRRTQTRRTAGRHWTMTPPDVSVESLPPSQLRARRALMLLVVVTCLSFAAFTQHMWEDYFITFRSSLNLALGNGLVFQPGERVHTFTSPLGTLLPALFALGGGDNVAVRALWLFRVASALALAGAIGLAARMMLRARLMPLAVAAGCLAWALDPKTVDFSINGMETAFLVLFIVLAWRALTQGARLLPCAIAFAGLQWTRPDGCVFFGVLALAWLVFGTPGADLAPRRRWWLVVRGVLLGVVFYLPWVAFAWWYYGSPIPHTILAKVSQYGPGELAGVLALYPWRLLFGHVALHHLFMPAYFFFGGWPSALFWISRLIVLGAAFAWVWRGVHPAGRIASLAFFLGGFYVEYIPRSPWYYPGWQCLAFVAWAYLLDAALRTGATARWAASLARIAAAFFVAVQACLLVAVAWEMREQQRVIEFGQRREMGRWLRAQAAPGDRVYLEPLGYIGFYSGLKMLDYPGLASPEVVAARRAGNRPHAQLIAALRPEWVVLRPDQIQGILHEQPALMLDYQLVRKFDVRKQVDAIRFLPGRNYLEFDAFYFVYHRAAAASPP